MKLKKDVNIVLMNIILSDICNVALHPECFGIYHKINVYNKKIWNRFDLILSYRFIFKLFF